jgi:ComEC/Rec2-related protein
MRNTDLVKKVVRVGQLCPALPLAVTVAVGQLVVWFLHLPEAAIVALVVGGATLFTPQSTRIVTAGVLCGVISGACSIVGRTAVLSSDDVAFQGVIIQEPRHPKTGEVVFTVRALTIAGEPLIRARAVELPWRNSALLREGDLLWLRGKLVGAERPLNPFSWQGWLYRRGISGELKVRWLSQPEQLEERLWAMLRERVESSISQRYGERRGGALFLSMAFGYQDRLSSYLEGAFKRVGLTHLLVVSGYQVSLVFLCVSWCLTRGAILALPGRNVRTVVPLLSFLLASLYVVFVGLEASASRALLAAGCVCAAVVGETGARFSQRWAVSLLAIQIFMPWAVFDLGVQLTFAALAGIGVGTTLGRGRRIATYLWVALGTWLFTGCVLAAWGGAVAPAGFLFNIILATPWSVLNCVVGSLGFLALLIAGDWMAGVLDLVVVINEFIAEWMVVAADGVLGDAYQPVGVWRIGAAVVLGLCGVWLCRLAMAGYRAAEIAR